MEDMLCGLLHRLPKDQWLTGLIAIDSKTGLFTFFWANFIPNLQQFKLALIRSGTREEEIIPFEGFPKEAIAIVRPLNDAIRAQKEALENQPPLPSEELSCSATA